MEVDKRAMLQSRRPGQQLGFDINGSDCGQRLRSYQGLPPAYFRHLNTGEVQGYARACGGELFRAPMVLHSPHAHERPPGSRVSDCPARKLPESKVPVTTVPNPFITKARSMGSRGR